MAVLFNGSPVALLTAVAVTGTGTVVAIPWREAEHAQRRISWEIVVSLNGGALTAQTTNLEGSLDGTNWYQLDQSTITTKEIRHVVNKMVVFVRANNTLFTIGAGAPTMTVNFYEA